MNFMSYGKTARSAGGARNAFIPEKYWAPTAPKPINRHDSFFKPQQEDFEENTPRPRNIESHDDTVLTIKATSFFNRDESTLYMAITEGRGNASCEVGIAAIDIKRPELIMSQISDNFWYTGLLTKIAILSPTEILMPQALINSSNSSKLYLYIKHTYPDVPIRAVPRRQFNDRTALEIIDHIHNTKYKSIRDMIAKKYYALTASSALLQYLECIMNCSFAQNSLKIRYESKYGCMTIDLDTSHHLELLYPTCKTKEQRACLFGVLNSCVTGIGKRNLRAQILQPSCELKQIIRTQECIKELYGNQDLFIALEAILTKFHSVDKLMKFAVVSTASDTPNSSETMISQILQLKACLEHIPELNHLIATINNTYFDDMKLVLVNTAYKEMLDEITTVIHPNVQITGGTTQFFQRLHAVNPNISSYLDLNRENYTKLVDKINEIIGNLSGSHNLPFRMKFITSKGFHIQLTVPKNSTFPQLPSTFEVLSKTKNSINLTTTELRMLNVRMSDVVEQIHIESNRIITELVNSIRHNMAHLYDLSGLISSLDIMLSLTKYSINSNGCCPTFSSEMNVIDGIHPLLEYNRCKTTPVPNGVIANSEYHFFVITGPNMGGKTIYLKMIAMLQILAQLGCFVPARTAQFRLTDKILSRIGFGDRIECNLSGFVLEMRETEYIFKNITPNSLVIIDELCRSTKPEEGEVLAWDICERFIRLIGVSNDGRYFDESEASSTSKSSNKSLKLSSITSPFIFFVTHFDSITKLQDKFLSVVNLHFSATEEVIDGKNHLTYTYRIEDGVNQIKNYGISLAQYMNFPPDVISRAMVISDELRQKQLPDRLNKSNVMGNNSSMNRRSTYRSTILETSTSEHSHLLRLFYNLYADMVSINRMEISTEEKRDLLTQKMRELADELPSHILEMAKKGTLFDLFKRTPNVPTHLWTPPESEFIHEEPLQTNVASQSLRNETDFSLLSQHSIARRVNLERQDMSAVTPFASPQTSNARNRRPTQQQSKVHFLSDSIEEIENSQLGDSFSGNAYTGRKAAATPPFIDDDRNFNFMDASIDFIDDELTQYFRDMSPSRAGTNFEDEPDTSDFVIPDILDRSERFAASGRVRSNQNTSTEAHPATSSKEITKSKSSNMNTTQRSSSSSSSGLFRLQLKSPLIKRDNRILKTPPKSTRTQNVSLDEFTFGTAKEPSEKRSTSRLSFNMFDETAFSGVDIPTIPSTSSDKNSGEFNADDVPTIGFQGNDKHYSEDSPSQPFKLNLTQFFSREISEDPFFLPSQASQTDTQPTFTELSDDIMPIQSKTPFCSTTNATEDESFTFSDIAAAYSGTAKPRTRRPDYNYGNWVSTDKLTTLGDMSIVSTSQEQSGNFFNFNSSTQDSSQRTNGPDAYKLIEPINQSYIRKVTVAPEITPPTALQFIQYAYQNQSDDESISDEEDIHGEGTRPSTVKTAPIPQGNQMNFQQKKAAQCKLTKSSAGNQSENVMKTGSDVIEEVSKQKLSTASFNTSISNDENVEDIILPVPPEFL
ncbi:mutS protein homolog 4-like [Bradysia coprophila]|uniref:mutS protein homolog 4-like n=1 Tax=Bradysia coprophila TaxID=38358 RepID=UPI00187D9E23|nr:mutS protein homolog 4-like [Bradysia coprophila]